MRECWVNVYRYGRFGTMHETRALAVEASALVPHVPGRLVCRLHIKLKEQSK